MAGWAAISLASGGSALSFWGALGRKGERRVLALCLSFLPSKICDSCEWLVTGYAKLILVKFSSSILCQIFCSQCFSFLVIFGALFLGFLVRRFEGDSRVFSLRESHMGT